MFRVETDLTRCQRDLAAYKRRNRVATEGVSALLAVPRERPRTWEAGHVQALADVLVAIRSDLTGRPRDDGGLFDSR